MMKINKMPAKKVQACRVGQSMILVFLNENKHKVNFNIKNFEMFFSLMIDVTMFFEFNIICNFRRKKFNRTSQISTQRERKNTHAHTQRRREKEYLELRREKMKEGNPNSQISTAIQERKDTH